MGLINFVPNSNLSPTNLTGFAAFDAKYFGALSQAINYVESLFNTTFANINNIQININIGADPNLPGAAANNDVGGVLVPVPYTDVVSALQNVLPTGIVGLPATDPLSGTNLYLSQAQSANLGFSPLHTQINATITLNSSLNWANDVGTNFSQLVGTIEHEVSEIMGRVTTVGGQGYTLMDVFRYSSLGVRELSPGTGSTSTGYFSLDGGSTLIGGGFFNNVTAPPGAPFQPDYADYSNDIVPGDSFGSGTIPSGTLHPLSYQDLYMLNAIGWSAIYNIQNVVPPGFDDWVGPNTIAIPGTLSLTVSPINLGSNKSVYGWLEVGSGGVANNDYIQEGFGVTGRATIENGGSANSTTIAGGTMEVQNGGSDSGTTILSGTETLDPGGKTSNFVVASDGTQQIDAAGVTTWGTPDGAGGQTTGFAPAATASNGTVEGTEIVLGIANNVKVLGGIQSVAGGTTNGTVLQTVSTPNRVLKKSIHEGSGV
jgi:autotransporter passenger strand-loop-strand repeat protein